MSFQPEQPYKHGNAARVGVLVVNLGTPDAPTRRRCAATWPSS